MNPPPFAISQYTSWPLTWAEDLALYRRLGITNIEVCESKLKAADPHPQMRELLAAGFRVTSVQPRIHSPFPNSLRAKPADPAARMARLRESIRLFGRYCSGTVLVLNTGLAPQGDVDGAWRVAVREFREAARFAQEHGVLLALEPLNPVYMNTDTFICSLAQAERMIDEVGHPSFGVFLDLWHFWEEPDAARRIRRFRGRIHGVHISDWRRPRAFGDRLLPGDGEIPVEALLRAIRGAGYRGVYTLEIFSDPKLRDSLWARPQGTVRAGREAFTKIWRKLCD